MYKKNKVCLHKIHGLPVWVQVTLTLGVAMYDTRVWQCKLHPHNTKFKYEKQLTHKYSQNVTKYQCSIPHTILQVILKLSVCTNWFSVTFSTYKISYIKTLKISKYCFPQNVLYLHFVLLTTFNIHIKNIKYKCKPLNDINR